MTTVPVRTSSLMPKPRTRATRASTSASVPATSTITLRADDVAVEQAAKQLYRLIDVLKVQDVTTEPTVQQELALVKIRATDSTRAEVLRLVELSRGRVVDLADGSVIVEVTGTESEVDAFVALVRTYGIKELVRTGAVVMARGSGSIEEAIKR